MAKAIKDATKVAKCEAKKAAKQAKKAAKQVKKAMKAEDKSTAWVEEMIGLYGLSHMCTYPYREDFGIDGPDGNPIWGKAAEECWKEHFDGDMHTAHMVDQKKDAHKSKAWVEEMIGLYGLSHMCTYPYREDFGIDGPDGNPIWGKAAEECWKEHFD